MADISVNVSHNTLYNIEKFIYEQNLEIINKIANDFNLDINSLIKEFLNTPQKQQSNIYKSDIDIISKSCHARVWGNGKYNNGKGTKCSRKKTDNKYCTTHLNQIKLLKSLTYGDYYIDPLPKIFRC